MASAPTLPLFFFWFLFSLFLLSCRVGTVEGETQPPPPLVPAIITFGDSSVDVGNNNHLPAMFKANFPPYGRDFPGHSPTGRFCNGKLPIDYTAEFMGFKSYPQAYLSRKARGRNLLLGANFASAGSGYSHDMSDKYKAIPLTQQLKHYREYKRRLARVAGRRKAAAVLSEAMYVISTGSGDYVQNYYIDASLRAAYGPEEFSAILLGNFSRFVKELHGHGARRIGVTSLAPIGCLPAAASLHGNGGCASRLNDAASSFNRKLRAAAASLARELPGLKMAVLDIYKPLLDMVTNPSRYGFAEARKGCCGTGTSGTSVLCRPNSPGVCSNASAYVFWDGVHLTQEANRRIADAVLVDGIALLS